MRRFATMLCALTAACGGDDGRDDTTTTPGPTGDPVITGAPTTGTAPDPSTGDPGTSTGPDDGTSSSGGGGGSSSGGGGPFFDLGGLPDQPAAPPLPLPQLWYSVDNLLVYIELNQADGAVAQLVTSTITNDPSFPGVVDSCSLTMLDDGSLLGGRGVDGETRLFHVPDPPTVAGEVEVVMLGSLPEQIYAEALYTDCDGRVYLMDTGADNVSNTGNRLLRFTGDYLAGDFAYEEITDLMVADAADIDDMSPGIDARGAVIDNPGFAIDSGTIYDFDYTTGTGTVLGMAGTYGIHALGGPLFDDGVSRLYVLDIDAKLFSADPTTLALSPELAAGPPIPSGGAPGNTSLAGPLTDCVSGFPQG
jgi:hypothetical protein